MKKAKTLFMALSVIFMGSLLLTCQKESDTPLATDNEVAFAINISNLKSATQLKSAMGYNLADADKIILTIQKSDGSPTKYTSSEIKIQQMNGVYYTRKIVLKTGNYKLTEFAIIDIADSTIFATPLTGSQLAQNVTNPLPILFAVTKDTTAYVNVEVLSTEKKKPEDFGLTRFPIIEVKTFDFMIGVADSESDKLLAAKLTVSNGLYSYVQDLDSIINNVVTVKDGLSNYTLKVEKAGYETYTHTYSMDSLKMFKDTIGNLPLLVDLEKEETVTDYDGNVYKTVVIGNQVWMAENLKSLHYSDGASISGVYAYNNDENNVSTYGRLYSWSATIRNTNIEMTQGVCPTGWHVPSDGEWTTLTTNLGGESVAGGHLKESGTTHWTDPNTGADNSSGFTALPAGVYGYNSLYAGLNNNTYFWSSTDYNGFDKWCRYFYYDSNVANRVHANANGHSVRCVKD